MKSMLVSIRKPTTPEVAGWEVHSVVTPVVGTDESYPLGTGGSHLSTVSHKGSYDSIRSTVREVDETEWRRSVLRHSRQNRGGKTFNPSTHGILLCQCIDGFTLNHVNSCSY